MNDNSAEDDWNLFSPRGRDEPFPSLKNCLRNSLWRRWREKYTVTLSTVSIYISVCLSFIYVWYGMVCYGMVWYGMVWYLMLCNAMQYNYVMYVCTYRYTTNKYVHTYIYIYIIYRLYAHRYIILCLSFTYFMTSHQIVLQQLSNVRCFD